MSVPPSVRRSRFRLVTDILLLPLALVVVVLEDVVWRGLKALLAIVGHLAPFVVLARWLAHLPGWIALPMFLVPEGLGRVGEFWAFALFYRGHVVSGVGTYIAVRLAATLMAVFIYRACAPALLRIGWFARAHRWVGMARSWAIARLSHARAWAAHALGLGRGLMGRRFSAARRRWRARV